MAACPICNEPVASRAASEAFPFCSARCKTIDLGRWLSDAYAIPADGDSGGEGSDEFEGSPQREILG